MTNQNARSIQVVSQKQIREGATNWRTFRRSHPAEHSNQNREQFICKTHCLLNL